MNHTETRMYCPVTKTEESTIKKLLLFFFRFGVCPACITASIGYGIVNFIKSITIKLKQN